MRPAAEIAAMHDLLSRRQLSHETADNDAVLHTLTWTVDPLMPDQWLWEVVEQCPPDEDTVYPQDVCENLVHLVGIDPGEESTLTEHLTTLNGAELIELARVAGRLQRMCNKTRAKKMEGK